jgi:alpha-N-arabinofuranosidase
MDAVCRFVQARTRSRKRAYLCFDEWNVWYKNHQADGKGETAPQLLGEVYDLEDALVVAGFLNSFIRHADVVKIANIAQVVNVIAPIQTRGDDLLIQSIFYPFEMVSSRREGVSLRPVIKGPTYESKSYGVAPVIDGSAILGDGVLHVFVTNRRLDAPTSVRIQVADKAITGIASAEILAGSDPKAANSWEQPERVKSMPFKGLKRKDGVIVAHLPPLSFAAMTLKVSG